MYDYTCSRCGQRYVLFPSQVLGISNDERGIVVAVSCWCGAPGEIVSGRARTGRGGPAAQAPVAA